MLTRKQLREDREMDRAADIIHREELCVTFGFPNRWTAKVYQWAREYFDGPMHWDDGDTLENAIDALRELVLAKNVPEERMGGIDFAAIALALRA